MVSIGELTNNSKKQMQYIPYDVISKIFSNLPPKTLFRFKCVSKEIQNLIEGPLFGLEHFMRLKNKTPFTGFFDYKNYSACLFISADIHVGGLPDSSLSVLEENMESSTYSIDLIDSCNGLLLCKVTCHLHNYISEKLYLCNPLTRQKLLIPTLPYKLSYYVRKNFALMAESTLTGYLRYKVVCVYEDHEYTDRSNDGPTVFSKLSIFSSERGEWEKFEDKFPELPRYITLRTKVFVNGALFWDCHRTENILVCYLNSKNDSTSFELIKSPTHGVFFRCLWDCDGKIMLYSNVGQRCQNVEDEYFAWSLCSNANKKLEWKIKSSKQFRTLAQDIWTLCNRGSYTQETLPSITELHNCGFRIVAYNPGSKTMYVWIYQALISYQVEERTTEWVSGFLAGSGPRSPIPYVHGLGPIEAIRKQIAINES